MRNYTLESIIAITAMVIGVLILVLILRDIDKHNNDLDL